MIFMGVGSSIGDAESIFKSAQAWLKKRQVMVIESSELLKNAPYGGVAQNEFTNAVWHIQFTETPWERVNWVLLPKQRRQYLKAKKLLKLLKNCESAHGRTKSKRWDDRPLDLDILQFNNLQICRKKLCIPHPEIPKRIFVLQPWLELVDPNYTIPKFGKLKDLLQKVKN